MPFPLPSLLLRRSSAPLAALVACALPACGDDGGGPTSNLRVAMLAPEAQAVDVRLTEVASDAEAPPFEALGFGDASPFRVVAATTWRVDVHEAGTDGPPLATLEALPLVEGITTTLVVSEVALDGDGDDLTLFLVEDAPVVPDPGRAAVRFVHAGVGLPDVRLYVDGALLRAGLPYRADVAAADLSPSAFELGVDFRDEPDADARGSVNALGRGASATGFLVRRPSEVPGVFDVELVVFEGETPWGTVPLE